MTAAIGMIETAGIACSIFVADAMLKMADIRIIRQDEVGQAYFTVFIEGDVGAVQLAIECGVNIAKEADLLIAYQIISRPLIEGLKIAGSK